MEKLPAHRPTGNDALLNLVPNALSGFVNVVVNVAQAVGDFLAGIFGGGGGSGQSAAGNWGQEILVASSVLDLGTNETPLGFSVPSGGVIRRLQYRSLSNDAEGTTRIQLTRNGTVVHTSGNYNALIMSITGLSINCNQNDIIGVQCSELGSTVVSLSASISGTFT